jgi:hypothetical protein
MVGRFNLFGPWIIGAHKDPLSAPNYLGFILFVGLVGISLRWALLRRERVELSLHTVLAGATILGFLSTTRIFGTFFEYVIRWMSPLVAMWIAASLWSCWLTWRARSQSHGDDRSVLIAARLGIACVLAVTAIGVGRAVAADVPYERDSAMTGELSGQLQRSLDRSTRYQINEYDPVALGAVAFGLALDLERHGLHAGVGPWGEAGVMPFRVVTDARADSTLWYVASTPVIDAFSTLPGAVVRASFDVRSSEEVTRSDQLESQLLKVLCSSGHLELRPLLFTRWGHTALAFAPTLPADAKPLLQQYTDLRQPGAVVELPVGVNGYDVAPPPHPCPD